MLSLAQGGTSNPSTALISASGALLGVLIGGLLNWYIQREVEARRQRAHARAGVRLLDIELRSSMSNLEVADTGYWPRGLALPTETWSAYREVLAVVLEKSEWATLAQAISALDHLNVKLAELGAGEGSRDVPISSEDLKDEVIQVQERIKSALDVCESLQRK